MRQARWGLWGALAIGCSGFGADPTAAVTSALETGRWEQVTPGASPPARYAGAMAWDGARQRLVLFGGVSGKQLLGDTWEWDGATWTEACASAACQASRPPARTAHALAYDEARHVTVLFGGRGASGQDLRDTWEWDGTSWAERCADAACSAAAPEARSTHGVTYDALHARTLMAGGTSTQASGALPETWAWDGTAWTQVASSGPFHGRVDLAYDTKHDRALAVLDDASVQAWDGATWAPIATTSSPTQRMFDAVAWDRTSSRLLVFGGLVISSSSLQADTWEWDGAAWTLSVGAGPSPRFMATVGFDGASGHALLFGGSTTVDGSVAQADTWRYTHLSGNGGACSAATECTSSNCLGGICCEPGCKGACSAAGTCLSGAICDGDHTLKSSSDGTTIDCAPYRCETGGVCKKSCGSVDDCVAGQVCDDTGHCASTAAAAPEGGSSGGCAAAAHAGPGAGASAAILAALSLVARRPRARRRGAARRRA